jgi:hypothetical protein
MPAPSRICIPDVLRHGLDRNAVLKDEGASGGVAATVSPLCGRPVPQTITGTGDTGHLTRAARRDTLRQIALRSCDEMGDVR